MQVNNFNNNNFMGLNTHKKDAQDAIEKLSSGKNKQIDDVALAMIASQFTTQMSGFSQGLENANDAVALLQVADGTLSGLSESANDLNALSIRYNNGSLNDDQKAIIRREADAIAESMQSSIDSSSFNGKDIFGGSFEFNLGGETISTDISAIDIASFDIYSQDGIKDLTSLIQETQGSVASTSNQLSSSARNLTTNILSLAQARSQMADADIATEVNNFQRSDLMLNVSSIVQSHQQNISAQRVSSLLA